MLRLQTTAHPAGLHQLAASASAAAAVSGCPELGWADDTKQATPVSRTPEVR